MWNSFMQLIFEVIQFFANIIGDWGLAIITVTVILRILLLPLTLKQMKSTADMQLLAPKLQELQDRYQDDPERLNQEMMKFYAENKFNPLAGCLPILLQMPIFIALFQVLRSGYLPDNAGFLNIISNLASIPTNVFSEFGFSATVPYIILVLFFGTLTVIPMFLQQQTGGQNAKMMKGMSIFMAIMMMWFGWNSPTGVLLFWDTSAAWGVVQQLIIMKKRKADAEAKENADNYKPIEVDVVRKQRKPRPTKKGKH